jgi:hypothetical protein
MSDELRVARLQAIDAWDHAMPPGGAADDKPARASYHGDVFEHSTLDGGGR